MYNTGKFIAVGIVFSACLVLFPFGYVFAGGKTANLPAPEIITEEKQCVEPAKYMRAKHMDLLNSWMESVVRQGDRTYVASDGKKYNMSLSDTCLGCHSNKSTFCDQCHNYVGITPQCWDCHITPQ